jgi:hypothetical protein
LFSAFIVYFLQSLQNDGWRFQCSQSYIMLHICDWYFLFFHGNCSKPYFTQIVCCKGNLFFFFIFFSLNSCSFYTPIQNYRTYIGSVIFGEVSEER